LGGFLPPGLNECALVIPRTKSADIYLEMCALANAILGLKGFLGTDPKLPLEPQMSLLKSCALSGYLLHTERFHRQNLMSGGSKDAPWLVLNWVGRNLQDNPWSCASTQKPSLTLAPSLAKLRNHCKLDTPGWHGELPGR
jgi:hypothetical protein